MKIEYDVIIIGAGAAGLMCAIESGKRGRKTLLVDHTEKTAEKIRISGGGRCNFTNIHAAPENYLSQNPHFCKSALKQYTQHDFIALVKKHGIAYHEKKLGQLFCDKFSQEIIDMLLTEIKKSGTEFKQGAEIKDIKQQKEGYSVKLKNTIYKCKSLVIATGGLSIPKIGASKFGYDLAKKFGLKIIPTRPALVPLTFQANLLDFCRALSGLSVDATVTCDKKTFAEGLLFTHRGLSGPSILQISSYWSEGQDITINLYPAQDVTNYLLEQKQKNAKQDIHNILGNLLPKNLAKAICDKNGIKGRITEISDKNLKTLGEAVNNWRIRPAGTEGYRTAEVTLGGIDTDELSSKTMECKKHKGLYFIGEVVDVTGHLGGYNFQWAWSSGYVAGRNV
tara:strand:- start:182 stop:1363 length:1182 start_codon:yes stop_codon:yes gene_type:complete